jgi:hypothetical protein
MMKSEACLKLELVASSIQIGGTVSSSFHERQSFLRRIAYNALEKSLAALESYPAPLII